MSNALKHHIKLFLDLHKAQVEKNLSCNINPLASKNDFNKHQAEFFDEQAGWYISENAIPEEVKVKLSRVVETAKIYCVNKIDKQYKILDVGSGAGALIPFIQNAFSHSLMHAIDLSKTQLDNLHSRYPNVVIHHGDISTIISDDKFDLILCNACFGNFYSQSEALSNMANLLSEEGIIAISHPLGAKFVAQLHIQDITTVPHLLPITDEEIKILCINLNLQIETFINEEAFYLLILKKI